MIPGPVVRGRVILTSSITGPITGFPGWTHYGASKAGELGFMRTAAIELARDGITVNAVLPGNIATEGLADLGEDYINGMTAAIPMRRLGTVEDIGNADCSSLPKRRATSPARRLSSTAATSAHGFPTPFAAAPLG